MKYNQRTCIAAAVLLTSSGMSLSASSASFDAEDPADNLKMTLLPVTELKQVVIPLAPEAVMPTKNVAI